MSGKIVGYVGSYVTVNGQVSTLSQDRELHDTFRRLQRELEEGPLGKSEIVSMTIVVQRRKE